MNGTGPLLRLARPEDAEAIAALFTASRALLDFLPQLHSPEEDRGFIRGHIMRRYRVTLAEHNGGIVGYMADEPGWIEQLYVGPGFIATGIGSALLADAMSRNERLELWCFLENRRARAFYGRHGFVEVERTDGAGNEAQAPDIRLRWERQA